MPYIKPKVAPIMKKILLTSFFTIFFLSLDFIAFAQPGPGNDNGDGTLEGDDDLPVAPINGKLIWLAIIGLAFAYYTYKNTRTVEVSK